MADSHSTESGRVGKAPAFQFYPRDFLSDYDVAAFTLEEMGAYTALLCYAWLKDGLPNDFDKMARALRVKREKLDKLWTVVGEKFALAGDGRWRNERQEQEREDQRTHRLERSSSGKRGNARRWGQPRQAVAQPSLSDENRIANHRSALASASAVCVPTQEQPVADAGAAWEQWREAWQSAGRNPLPLGCSSRDYRHLVSFASRYPDADWRALMLTAFFVSDDPQVRKSPPSLGWFVSTWMDEIDKRLRDTGRRPKSEVAA